MKKSISLILVLSMLLAAMLGVTSAAEEEPAATAKLDITYANLMFSDSVYPLFAVDYTAVYTGDKAEASALAAIKLEVYRNGVLVDTLKPTTEVAAPQPGTIAFKQESFGFKNMGDIYTYRAVNGTAENASDDIEYSVLEYALESSMLGNDKLTNVVEKMIAVGAAAQTAFDYTDYDYDLNEKYGMVIVGGATAETRKTLAKVGETVTPAMNSAAFPAGAELYDTATFEPATAATIAVTEGVSRYFYFGTDIYGDKAGAYTTATDHTGTDFNMAKLNTTGSYIFDKDNDSYTSASNKAKSGNVMFQMPYNKPNAWTISKNQATGWGETGNNRYISVISSDKANVLNYSGGSIDYVAKKYLLINSVSDTGTTSPWALTSGSGKPGSAVAQPFDPDNFLKNGKFTIGFSIAKKAGVSFSTTESSYKISASGGDVPLFSVSGSSLVYGDTKLVDFVEFTGDAPASAADYTSFYIVVDVNANTMTVYGENGKSVSVALDLSNSGKTNMVEFLSGNQGFSWNFPSNGGQAYINRITYMVGDIFA